MDHTPGPWSVGHTRDTTERYQHTSFEVPVHVGAFGVNGGPGNALAIVYLGGKGAIDGSREAVEANARLIAQAPELLKVLKGILVIHTESDTHMACNCPYCQAWAIIQRVEDEVVKG